MQIKQALYSEINDTLLVQYPVDYYEPRHLKEIYKAINKSFPKGRVLMIPDNITLSIFKQGDIFI